MKTIEERTIDFIKSKDTSALILTHNGVSGAAKEIYKIGATEQREIDIQRAWEFIEKTCTFYDMTKEKERCTINKGAFIDFMKGE